MLIISRRKGQRIVIGHDLEVIVTDLSRSTVKLGIKAPTQTVVMRGEVRDSIEAANREAASSPLELTIELTRVQRTPEPPQAGKAATPLSPAELAVKQRAPRPARPESPAEESPQTPEQPPSVEASAAPKAAEPAPVTPPTPVRRPLGGLEVIRRRPRG